VPPSCTMGRVLALAGGLLIAVVVVIGLTQTKGSGDTTDKAASFDLPAAKRKLATAPAPLNGLYAQANELLNGGTTAFSDRLAQLKGHPLVINKWASWCGPCQAEFSIFQDVATARGANVGFIGLNVSDVDSHARGFLAKRPLPFPSYVDPDEKLTASLKAPLKFAPLTIFLAPDGKVASIHTGAYTSEAQLNTDIDRYLSS
jgi:cytochrome c biogenesis protein CcmG/thiol:disulfide interchange protein DsbE